MRNFFERLLLLLSARRAFRSSLTSKSETTPEPITIDTSETLSGQGPPLESPSASDTIADTTPPPSSEVTGTSWPTESASPPLRGSRVKGQKPSSHPFETYLYRGSWLKASSRR